MIANISRSSIPRFNTFGNGGAIIRSMSAAPLNTDALRERIPSIFAEDKHTSRSARYEYIPTASILERLASEDFHPYAAMQGGSRDDAKKGYTKHLVRLRHASQITPTMDDPTVPEIILLNSHDGTSSYRMMGGLFRLVCANGLVLADGALQEIRVKHTGKDIPNQVLDGCIEIMEALPKSAPTIESMRALNLSPAEQTIFARAALTVRYPDADAPITAEQVIRPNRREDAAPNLWTTLNTVQENIVRGGVRYIRRDDHGRRTAIASTRPINGIDQNTAVNRALWQLAEEMKALKA